MKEYHVINSEVIAEGDDYFMIMKSGSYLNKIKIPIAPSNSLHLTGELELLKRGLKIFGYGELGNVNVIFFTDDKPLIPKAQINWLLIGMMAGHYYWQGNNGSVYNITDEENVPIGGFSSPKEICDLKGLPDNAFQIVKKLDDESRHAD